MNASTAAAAAAEEEGTIASILLSLPDENDDDDDEINPNYNYDSINSVDVQKSITAIKGSSSFETTVSPNSVATSPSILNNLQKSHQRKNTGRQRSSSSSSSSSLSRRRCTTDAGVSISPPDLNNSINTIGHDSITIGHDSRLLIDYTDEDRRSFLSRRCPTGHGSRILIDYKNVDDDNDDGNDQNENEGQNNDQRGKTKIESTKKDDDDDEQAQAQLQRRNSSAVQVQQQRRRSSSHRVVRFSRKVTVREIRSHHDYTPRQIKKCWYQEDEVNQIKVKCLRILKQQKQKQKQKREHNIMKKGEDEDEDEESSLRNNEEDEDEHSINNDIERNFGAKEDYVDDEEEEVEEEDQHEEYCLRGLESYEPIAYKRKKRLRNKSQQIVFDINDQSYGNDYCNEMIAEYYSNITSNCSLVAHIIGLQDERDACAAYS